MVVVLVVAEVEVEMQVVIVGSGSGSGSGSCSESGSGSASRGTLNRRGLREQNRSTGLQPSRTVCQLRVFVCVWGGEG